jgi:DNA-binding CsgD family transcriptional regulator
MAGSAPDGGEALQRGRACYERREWASACRALLAADESEPLGREDLLALAWSAALAGQIPTMLATLERVYQAELDANEPTRAARAAFWAGMRLVSMGELGRASGWLARAQRIVDELGRDCVERGYLLLPQVHRALAQGDFEGAAALSAQAVALGAQFLDADLTAFARNLEGRALMLGGRVSEGMTLLDEAMLPVSRGELSPQITGLTYCSVIAACHAVFELDRVREWTLALSDWCKAQPELGGFSGICLVHRSEIMQLSGAWPEAFDEARRASERLAGTADARSAAEAAYQEAEIHRLRGERERAEEGYRRASSLGRDPQPGLALLRLAEGRRDIALASIRRVLLGTQAPLARAKLLPASCEIELAAGHVAEARESARELDALAATHATDVLVALAATARGAVELEERHPEAAVGPLRTAFRVWQELGAPYLGARVRVLLGRACRELGDEEATALELGAARDVFERLGAAHDLAGLDAFAPSHALPAEAPARDTHGLTPRELEVLLHVASGKTNRAIAKQLHLSEKTVDRHVSNIFTKLDVPSRAAATAFAYRHGLVAR